MPASRSTEKLKALLQKETVVDLPAIQQALGAVSIQTAFRYLKLIPYRRSYDHNGRYYTLYEASRFDREGLWSVKGIHFSVDGSLKHTVRRLVYEASAGATHKELHQKLQLRVQNTLLDLWRKAEICRQAPAGFYVYLHIEELSVRLSYRNAESSLPSSRRMQILPMPSSLKYCSPLLGTRTRRSRG